MVKRSPIFVIVLCTIVPLVYLAAYCSVVIPGGEVWQIGYISGTPLCGWRRYRLAEEQAAIVFWPVEQADRKLRPKIWEGLKAWEDGWGEAGPPQPDPP
ncbi:hypothetical protein NA78x_004893 [Anatilimnocola sp. NA78]|uniref:hypothetical protein n=1 Tax=Anatilimnocola sp. NA78 TaxID=3415683 RepID=UPI003CE57F3F